MAEVNTQAPPHTCGMLLRHHLGFALASALTLWAMYTLLRAALLVYNLDLVGATPASVLAESFRNGARFDLRLVAYICIPLVLAILSYRAMAARSFHVAWLTIMASLTLFLGLVELDFYREFQQRLNSLFFQYLNEDPATVISMLWHGFAVVRYLLCWLVLSAVLLLIFRRLDHRFRPSLKTLSAGTGAVRPWYLRLAVFLVCLLLVVALARGTLQQGPPLRWGAAYTTDSLFANQLGLNASLSLVDAAKEYFSSRRANIRKPTLPDAEATATVRAMLLAPGETLVDADTAAVRRRAAPAMTAGPQLKNVVIILLESFAGHYVGALGGEGDITPQFDALSREGLLFTRFFSNGTHTHQGMFATMACFPNLPGLEYLMQQPEGSHRFSGLPQLLGAEGFQDLYVYNGDFSWDNQAGFFRNQGLRHYIGRNEFIDPIFSDPTWGVSDQDMFERAAQELGDNYGEKPFYALLQTLSNHTPYALPEKLPVAPVTGFDHLDEHLTAMRYSDWALGQFFEKARRWPFYEETLFVVVGDHGFSTPQQLTDMNLYRYYVPLLLIAPGMQQRFGARNDIAATQVDVVPTIMGRLGMPYTHQCWGRDLLALDPADRGFGVIKPSGSDQTVAIIEGDRVLVQPPDQPVSLFSYSLDGAGESVRLRDEAQADAMRHRLEAYLQAATGSLLGNSAGADK
ncbi:MAG: LTA synthase family protein [Halioglobus sp.]|nr:LTA synthase family protein [Halioglobus sp.]